MSNYFHSIDGMSRRSLIEIRAKTYVGISSTTTAKMLLTQAYVPVFILTTQIFKCMYSFMFGH